MDCCTGRSTTSRPPSANSSRSGKASKRNANSLAYRTFRANKAPPMNLDFYYWMNRFRTDGLTPLARLELRELLAPRVVLSPPLKWEESDQTTTTIGTRIQDLVRWELVLNGDDVHTVVKELNQIPKWQASLPEFLSDATSLLREALDLMRDLGGASDRSDLSYLAQPSIAPH